MHTMFLLHGITSFDPKENTLRVKHYPESDKFDKGVFRHNGTDAPFYVSRAKNEKALVVGASGLKSQYLLDPTEVKRLNDNGISIIWMALPEIRNNAPFMDRFKDTVEAFLTSKDSPRLCLVSKRCHALCRRSFHIGRNLCRPFA